MSEGEIKRINEAVAGMRRDLQSLKMTVLDLRRALITHDHELIESISRVVWRLDDE